jgi:phosphoglycolate phosphatase
VRPTVLLFDVDGTLVTTDGAGRRALSAAFEVVVGRATIVEGLDFAGTTDPFIVRHGLRTMGLADEPGLVHDVLHVYVERLREELAVPGTVTVHAGVPRVLEAVTTRPDVAVGLGTGNVEPGAWAKVGAGGLDGAFAFGGFGSDDEDRPTLLRIGAARGAAMLGAQVGECRVVVIGDTPRDLAAAHAIGAACVLVATGRFDADELTALGAEPVFESLEADGVVEAVLGDRSMARGGMR